MNRKANKTNISKSSTNDFIGKQRKREKLHKKKTDKQDEIIILIPKITDEQLQSLSKMQVEENVVTLTPPKKNLFSKMSRNMMGYLSDFFSFTDLKIIIKQARNKRMSQFLIPIYHRKFINFELSLVKKEKVNLIDKRFIKTNNYDSKMIEDYISYLPSLKMTDYKELRNILLIPSQSLVVKVEMIGKLKVIKSGKVVHKKNFGKSIVVLKHFPEYDSNIIFISTMSLTWTMNLTNFESKELINLPFTDILFNKSSNSLIALDVNNKIYKIKFDSLESAEKSVIQTYQTEDLKSDVALLDIKAYDGNMFIYHSIFMDNRGGSISISNKHLISLIAEDSFSINLMNVNTMEKSISLKGHVAPIMKVVYSPNYSKEEDTLISISQDSQVRVWSMKERNCIQVVQINYNHYTSFAIFPYSLLNVRSDTFIIKNDIDNLIAVIRLKATKEEDRIKYIKYDEIKDKSLEPDLDSILFISDSNQGDHDLVFYNLLDNNSIWKNYYKIN